MTEEQREKFRSLAREIAENSIVTKALARLIEQIIETVAEHPASPDPRDAEVERLREALEDFVKWSEAYPTSIFIEPDFERAHALLQAGGMTLDAISASVLRMATKETGKRARAALDSPQLKK